MGIQLGSPCLRGEHFELSPQSRKILVCSCMPSKGQPVVIDLLYWPVVTLFTLDKQK